MAAGALSAVAAGELNNDTGDRARRSSTLTPASDLVPCTYFTGRTHEDMRYRAEDTDVSYPNEGFTISLRVKPEGGQISPAVVIGKYATMSVCNMTDSIHSNLSISNNCFITNDREIQNAPETAIACVKLISLFL